MKGSGRSIEAYSMYDELVKCQDLLEQFGGHPMAAGLSLQEENVEALRRRLNRNCTLTQQDLTEKIVADAAMPIAYISKNLVYQLRVLEPFGKGNTKPLFAQKDLQIMDCRLLGKNNQVLRLRLGDNNGASMSAVYFGDAQKFYKQIYRNCKVAILYYPDINSYQGHENLQVVISHYKVY